MKLINIPNIITCLNLICGCFAILFGMTGQTEWACLFILEGAVFDFFDGLTARALGISGPIGKELDSLADVVTFGIAPSVLAFQILLALLGEPGALLGVAMTSGAVLPICACFFVVALMAAFSALRLAKFNCDERQTTSFIGLPTPANALFWIGMTFCLRSSALSSVCAAHPYLSSACVIFLILGLSLLLISEVPMFSLKVKPGHMSWAENKLRYSFLGLTVILLIAFAAGGHFFASFALIILLYVVFSLVGMYFGSH